VSSVAFKEFKIRRIIVLAIVVSMVNHFLCRLRTPENLFHYEPVFSNIPVPAGFRMIRMMDQDIARFVDLTSPFPGRIILAGLLMNGPWNLMTPKEARNFMMIGSNTATHLRQRHTFFRPLTNFIGVRVAKPASPLAAL
jgi:hypothetical protein